MTSTTIVIASVLKPVYEPRMYEKIAITLTKNRAAIIHVVGYGTVDQTVHSSSVQAHGLGSFKRLSFKRLFASWQVLRLLFQLKPTIAIACTHELLIPFLLYKIIHPSVKLVYDLQENYYLNILHTQAFPSFLRWAVAAWVRWKERLTLPFYSQIIAAENCYLQEIPFIQSKAIVVANKAVVDPIVLQARRNTVLKERTCLLFSGTISSEYGIYEAIDLAEKLYDADASFYLRIVGYCADQKEQKKLQDYIHGKSFIETLPFDQPMPHTDILKAISEADWGLVAYRDNVATRNRIPTKLYEYISHQLPVLCTTNPVWQELVTTYDAGLCINYKQTHIDLLIRLLKMPGFYRSTAHPVELTWEVEEKKLETLFL
ncbi:MAG: glycosyltransferase [Chitinophagaceae bacterium]|nr:glycosyltransferase [Chitinophagaceae bacterium]